MFNKNDTENLTAQAKEQFNDFAQTTSNEWEELKDKAYEMNPFREKTTWEKIKDQFAPEEKSAWKKLTKSQNSSIVEDYEFVGIILGTIAAFGLGFALHAILSEKKLINPNKVLEEVKNVFKEDGPIEGSWIEMTPVPWDRYSYHTDVYYGGITRVEDGERVQYEFIVDAHKGTLMNLYRV